MTEQRREFRELVGDLVQAGYCLRGHGADLSRGDSFPGLGQRGGLQGSDLVRAGQAAAVRAYFGTAAVPFADTTRLRQGARPGHKGHRELLAIIERPADDGAGVTTDSDRDEPLARQPEPGGQAEVIRASSAIAPRGKMLTQPRTYEITFTGRPRDVLCTAFDDCTVTLGPSTRTLRAQLPDQAALWGLVQRVIGLRLEVVDLDLVAPE